MASAVVVQARGLSTGWVQHTMSEDQEFARKTRPMSAGLTKFLPRPPNSILTMKMAKKLPTTGSHRGAATGRLKASRMPVTTAERSKVVFSHLRRRQKSASKPTQERTLTATCTPARMPKM